MYFEFAPMEGLTSHIYRQVHHSMFPGVNAYYSPFIAPDSNGNFKSSHLRGLLPDNNEGIPLIPQILANHSGAFVEVAHQFADLGYPEVNLNAGCPSGTVVSKHKGSGMLSDPDSFRVFLDDIFSRCRSEISIKTRMGMESTSEFGKILELYNDYPVKELIIHARDRKGMYKSLPDTEGYAAAFRSAKMPVSYNGNLFTKEDLDRLLAVCPETDHIMIGRGAIANPALFRQLSGGSIITKEEMKEYHDRILEDSLSSGLSPNFAVMRMKELWYYMISMYPGSEKAFKQMNKSTRLEDYRSAASMILNGPYFSASAYFEQR